MSASAAVFAVGAIFLAALGAGCALLLPLFSARDLGKGFFALHGAIAAIAALLALLLDGAGQVVAQPAWGWAVVAASALGALAAGAELRRLALTLFALAAGAGAGLLATMTVASRVSWTWAVIWLACAAFLLATTTMTMNLGHWYLVSKDLPYRHLLIWAWATLGAAMARGVLFGAIVAIAWRGGFGYELHERLFSLAGEAFFLATRFLWGIVGTAGLSIFVVKTARMRSNQAATGLLYVLLVFVMVGELLAAYLLVRTGLPL